VSEGGTVAGIDATLELGGVVTGTVVSDSDGLPVSGVSVALVRYTAEDGWQEDWDRVTDANGRYEMTGVYPGTYRLKFDGRTAGHDLEYWDDQATVADGIAFRVDSATTVERDASLRKRSTISGTLTDTDGQPVQGVCAEAYSKRTTSRATAPTRRVGTRSEG
jgi:5-hydroxyisourate hydrolase-like protein (transthyretin family)